MILCGITSPCCHSDPCQKLIWWSRKLPPDVIQKIAKCSLRKKSSHAFIRKLPHHLVESFKSTLDEAIEADILLHVVDISHPAFEDQMNVVNEILKELKCESKPVIIIFNKMDLYEQKKFDEYLPDDVKKNLLEELKQSWMAKTHDNCIFVSATLNRNTADLRELLFQKVKKLYLQRYPYKAGYWTDYTEQLQWCLPPI